jgi:DNA invertase Pin-like site-specific DNA recombinase
MLVGYARVSTIEQNLDRQLEALKIAGCDKIYSEKLSGANTDRPQLQLMFKEIKEGDTIIITDLTRFSRSTMDLFRLIELIKEKKCFVKSLKDTWLDISEENPYSQFLLTVMAGVAQLERDLTRMRQKEGIALAKKKGLYKGRPKLYTENNPRFSHALELYEAGGRSIAEICKICSISESTFYRHMRKAKTV